MQPLWLFGFRPLRLVDEPSYFLWELEDRRNRLNKLQKSLYGYGVAEGITGIFIL
ncbi:hypothetical protein CJ030_MR5G025786 [Morella rubra]|uniref:Uncharacterized protein n=1 Tax=Morella rubra TaxID=262757 RepID=A0A6A1VK46_9ROSI|nr:hypothetical protein CJ030_MR5G025786 [Morella rubra]